MTSTTATPPATPRAAAPDATSTAASTAASTVGPVTEQTRRAPRSNGGCGRGKPPKINQAECVRLFLAGWTLKQLAEKYGVQRAAIQYRLRTAYVRVEDRPTPTPTKQAAAKASTSPGVRPPAPGWEEHAACLGVDDDGGDRFHPSVDEKSDHSQSVARYRAYENARTMCRACPVTVDCLRAALSVETPSTRWGIWGGLSPRQRSEIPATATTADLVRAVEVALDPAAGPDVEDVVEYSVDEMRAANTARDAWRCGRRGPLTAAEAAAYRAYQRYRGREQRRRQAESEGREYRSRALGVSA